MLPECDMFVVYENPPDSPGQFVVRRHAIVDGVPVADARATYVGRSLEDARAAIPPGRSRMARHPQDERPIVELWI